MSWSSVIPRTSPYLTPIKNAKIGSVIKRINAIVLERVVILAPGKDAAGTDALLKEIEAGKINFDILIATPDAMPRLAKVARVLGPKGLMPNPKNGTVTPNPEATAEKYAGGHMTFKTEAKAPVLHLAVGKLSFGKDKLEENIKAALKAVDSKNMKKITLKSTMSPAIRLSL